MDLEQDFDSKFDGESKFVGHEIIAIGYGES
jgi:hypothetical protein